MELSPGTAAGGFAAFAAQEVERALGQRPLGSHSAELPSQGAILAPEPLTESGNFVRHSVCIYTIVHTDCKRKSGALSKKPLFEFWKLWTLDFGPPTLDSPF